MVSGVRAETTVAVWPLGRKLLVVTVTRWQPHGALSLDCFPLSLALSIFPLPCTWWTSAVPPCSCSILRWTSPSSPCRRPWTPSSARPPVGSSHLDSEEKQPARESALLGRLTLLKVLKILMDTQTSLDSLTASSLGDQRPGRASLFCPCFLSPYLLRESPLFPSHFSLLWPVFVVTSIWYFFSFLFFEVSFVLTQLLPLWILSLVVWLLIFAFCSCLLIFSCP